MSNDSRTSNTGSNNVPASPRSSASAAFSSIHFRTFCVVVVGTYFYKVMRIQYLDGGYLFRTPAVGAHVQFDDSMEHYTTRPSHLEFQLEPVRTPAKCPDSDTEISRKCPDSDTQIGNL